MKLPTPPLCQYDVELGSWLRTLRNTTDQEDVLCHIDPSTSGIYVYGNCSALSFTDRCKVFDGEAVTALQNIQAKPTGNDLDHDTLPPFATFINKATKQKERDLGAMISILVQAVIELAGEIEKINKKLESIR